MVQVAAGARPINTEPDKCEGWEWVPWDKSAPQWSEKVFYSLENLRSQSNFDPFASTPAGALAPILPAWAEQLAKQPGQQRVMMREWEDEKWRVANGWQGSDLIHGRNSAVRILAYFWDPAEQTLRCGASPPAPAYSMTSHSQNALRVCAVTLYLALVRVAESPSSSAPCVWYTHTHTHTHTHTQRRGALQLGVRITPRPLSRRCYDVCS